MEMLGIMAGFLGLILLCYLLIRAIHTSTVDGLEDSDYENWDNR